MVGQRRAQGTISLFFVSGHRTTHLAIWRPFPWAGGCRNRYRAIWTHKSHRQEIKQPSIRCFVCCQRISRHPLTARLRPVPWLSRKCTRINRTAKLWQDRQIHTPVEFDVSFFRSRIELFAWIISYFDRIARIPKVKNHIDRVWCRESQQLPHMAVEQQNSRFTLSGIK